MGIDDISFSPFDENKNTDKINVETKFVELVIMAGSFHAILIVLFLLIKCMPMLYVNCFSVVWYLFLGIIYRKTHNTMLAILMAHLEIYFHSIMACVFAGWDMHFQLYMFALVPICAYIIDEKKDILSVINTIIFAGSTTCVTYLLCFELKQTIDVSATYPTWLTQAITFFNIITTFSFCSFVTVFDVMENYQRHSNLVKKEKELSQLTHSDLLTGLYNRSSMRNYFDKMQMDGKKYYIVIADLDNLVGINEVCGREAGDKLLRNMARVFVNEVSYNGYVSRWSNEEVLVLKEYESLDAAYKAMDSIRINISLSKVKYGSEEMGCTMSFGITSHKDGDSINESIRIARAAMEQAKQRGGDRIVIAEGEKHGI